MSGKNSKEKVELFITDLATKSDGIAEYKGQICYVKGAFPGERVLAQIESYKPVIFAKVLKILEPSAHRIESICPVYEKCGGCPFITLEASAQKQAKISIMKKLFNKDVSFFESYSVLGYRQLARLQVKVLKKGSKILGFYGSRSRNIVDIDSCFVLTDSINKAIYAFKKGPMKHLESDVEIKLSSAQEQVCIHVISDTWLEPAFYKEMREMVPDVFSGVVFEVEKMVSCIAGSDFLKTIGVDGLDFFIPSGGFGQANDYVNRQINKTIAEFIDDTGPYNRALELFSGAGNFTVSIGVKFPIMDTVEIDKRAHKAALENLRFRKFENIRTHCQDVLTFMEKIEKFDILIMDPPRAGAADVCKKILSSDIRTVIYISCNPVSLKNDISILSGAGFELASLRAFDMFPCTAHLEQVALLCR